MDLGEASGLEDGLSSPLCAHRGGFTHTREVMMDHENRENVQDIRGS